MTLNKLFASVAMFEYLGRVGNKSKVHARENYEQTELEGIWHHSVRGLLYSRLTHKNINLNV